MENTVPIPDPGRESASVVHSAQVADVFTRCGIRISQVQHWTDDLAAPVNCPACAATLVDGQLAEPAPVVHYDPGAPNWEGLTACYQPVGDLVEGHGASSDPAEVTCPSCAAAVQPGLTEAELATPEPEASPAPERRTPYLTREERQLLAAASRHLRQAGWRLEHGIARHPSGLVANWQYPWYLDGKTGRMLQIRCVNGGGWTQRVTLEVDVDSVREAVDHAVAHGLLPQGMSSAYQAGRERGQLESTERLPDVEIDLDAIRAREAAATPGPWQWFGNTDVHDVYLATRRWGRQYVMRFARWGMQWAQPVFAAGRTWKPDPQSMSDFDVDFSTGSGMVNASKLPIFEVAPNATSRLDPKVYRADLVGFRNPDAEFIAHARQDVTDLLAEVDRLRKAATR